jgi:hypothetical protein
METKKCPFCQKTVMAMSKVCKHCGGLFDEIQIAEVKKEDVEETPSAEPAKAMESVPTPTYKPTRTKKCPACGKTVLAVSEVCKHCGKLFDETLEESVPETISIQSQLQTTNNEIASSLAVELVSEQIEEVPFESLLPNEEHEATESNQNDTPISNQPTSPLLGQQEGQVASQNLFKSLPSKAIKWIIYVIGVMLIIGGITFGLLITTKNYKMRESIQLPKEDTIPAKLKTPTYLGIEPTIRYSAPADIVTSSGEHFSLEAGDFFIGVIDKNGNLENGKLYNKEGRQKHIILPKSDH